METKKKNRSQNARLKIVPKNSGDKNFVPKILGTIKIALLGGGGEIFGFGNNFGNNSKKMGSCSQNCSTHARLDGNNFSGTILIFPKKSIIFNKTPKKRCPLASDVRQASSY